MSPPDTTDDDEPRKVLNVRVDRSVYARIGELSSSRAEYGSRSAATRAVLERGLDSLEFDRSPRELRDRVEELEEEVDDLERRVENPTLAEWVDTTQRGPDILKYIFFSVLGAGTSFISTAIVVALSAVGVTGLLFDVLILLALTGAMFTFLGPLIEYTYDRFFTET